VAIGALVTGFSPALALGLAAVSIAVSPSPLEGFARSRQVGNHRVFRLLKLVMAFAGLPAVAIFTVAAASASPLGHGDGAAISQWELLVVTVAVGVLVGYALVVLVRGEREHMRLLTLSGGSMCLVAGATAVLGLPALPAAACAGAVLVNRSFFPHAMLRVAHALERPVLVAMLVLVGASWQGAAFSLAAFALLTGGRLAAAVVVGAALGRTARRHHAAVPPASLGFGLLPQGELALGLLVAIISFFPQCEGILEAVVAAIIVNNLIAAWWMRWKLGGAAVNGSSA
jgi:hypothetical protein